MKKGTLKIIIFISIIAVVLIVGIIIVLGKTGSNAKSNKQLALGDKALLEMDYEEAILFYEEAIKLNPKNVDAYLKIAETYVALGDYSAACEYLIVGFDITGDTSIGAMLDSLQSGENISREEQNSSGGILDIVKNLFNKADNNVDDSQDNSVGDGTDNNGFDPYSFTFFGYPVHTDCYEELKAASGYTGNDVVVDDGSGDQSYIAPGNGYGENIMCTVYKDTGYKSFTIVDEIIQTGEFSTFMKSAAAWNYDSPHSDYKCTFFIDANLKYKDVIAANFDGPIKLGTSLADAVKIIGCDFDPSMNESGQYVAEDGSTVWFTADSTSSTIEKSLLVINDKYDMTFGFINDVVEMIDLKYK